MRDCIKPYSPANSVLPAVVSESLVCFSHTMYVFTLLNSSALVVTRDHDDSDACLPAQLHRGGHFNSRRVQHAHTANESQIGLWWKNHLMSKQEILFFSPLVQRAKVSAFSYGKIHTTDVNVNPMKNSINSNKSEAKISLHSCHQIILELSLIIFLNKEKMYWGIGTYWQQPISDP